MYLFKWVFFLLILAFNISADWPKHAKKTKKKNYTWKCNLKAVILQWSLLQWTPPITEASTMQTRGHGPGSFPIVYCTCDFRIAETSLLWIMDTESCPNRQINTNYWVHSLCKNTSAWSHIVRNSEVPLYTSISMTLWHCVCAYGPTVLTNPELSGSTSFMLSGQWYGP